MTMRHLLVTAILIALPAHAVADDAKSHIARAKALHADGKPAAALLELKTAYALEPQPSLLYAMGQIHVQLGECETAITYYERFLETKPAADLADLARQAIETCRTSPPPATATAPAEEPAPVAAPIAPPPQPPAPPPAPRSVTRPWYRDKLGVALAGAGVVTGVAGIVVWTSARSDRDAADHVTLSPGLLLVNPLPRAWYLLFLTSLSGFTSFVSHAGGPPINAYVIPMRLPPLAFAASMSAFFFVINLSKWVPYAWLGLLDMRNMATSLALMPLAPVCVLVGVRLAHRVDPVLFYRLVYAGMFLTGCKLVWDGFF